MIRRSKVFAWAFCIQALALWGWDSPYAMRSSPQTTDSYIAYGSLSTALALEFGGKPILAPEQPRWRSVPSLDGETRESLAWNGNSQFAASFSSDVLLFGGFIPAMVWLPATNSDYMAWHLPMVESLAYTMLATNVIKYSVGRQRPYSFYDTRKLNGRREKSAEDNLSFVSGHASASFALAMTMAHLLSDSRPEYRAWYYGSLLGAAGLTAYFRIAGDMHYLSDVLAGALLGSLISLFVTEVRYRPQFRADIRSPGVSLAWHF